MKRQILLIACAVILACAPPLRADAVLDWNAISTQVIFAAGRPGPSPIIDFAVVAATVHDAVQAYDKKFEAYATEICDAEGSPAAAIAKANHDVLTNRFPAQTAAIDTVYANYLAANDIDEDDPGIAVGAAAAAGMIALRADDGAFPPSFPPFIGAEIVGIWRPTPSFLPGPPAVPGPPPSFAPMAVPWAAEVTPFVVLSPEQFRCAPPISLGSAKYRKDYDEVKALGALVNSSRTPAQTHIAYLWAGNFFAQINDVLRELSARELDCSADRARLFALTWLAAGDAFINTWNNKVFYPTWRPITAIREGQNDGNSKTVGDPNWQPLINTPNYPDHCSGANAFVASTTKTMSLFFKTDHMTFTVTTINPNAVPPQKTYNRFSDARADLVEARVLQGIHFRTADLEGRKLGQKVAKWVFKHALRPLRGHKHDCRNHDCYDSDDDDDN